MAKTILLADDSVTIQKVVELTFMDEDYQVVATGDGASALEQIPELNPDLVIADVHMPGADGYEVCRRTKAAHPSIPVLLLVGTFEQFDEQKAAAVQADGHLKKPFDSQDLLSQVESLVGGAGEAAEAAEPAAAVPGAEDEIFELDQAPPMVGDLEPPSLEVPDLEAPPAVETETAAPDFFSTPMPDLDAAPPPAVEVTETAPVDLGAFGAEPPAVDLEAPTHHVPTVDPEGFEVEALEAPSLEAPAIEDFELAEAEPAAEDVSEAATWDSIPVTVGRSAAGEPAAEEVAAEEPAFEEPVVEETIEAVPAAEPEVAAPEVEDEPAVEAPAAEEPTVAAVASVGAAEPTVAANGSGPLSDEDIERIAQRVAELVGGKALRDVAWEVLPDLAEVIIKERIRELESQVV